MVTAGLRRTPVELPRRAPTRRTFDLHMVRRQRVTHVRMALGGSVAECEVRAARIRKKPSGRAL
ncbi:hypothetical protein [Streptomyces noursei]|uniref:hypothetical protein n=1 Tax=Streptomyces noursei TaxID=1971 RepID=UPI0016773935|nr:hypothetical protein [Streptomyces noursei]MCZ1013507.1 hypothetical protein [Streptomyces noursei]GGX35863.1 hypothetical protein GCM10010341_66760 [Streptomyces noursei]